MKPREVIARAIFSAETGPNDLWDDYYVNHPDYFKMAEAVIDALEKMDVTSKMWGAGVEAANAGGVEEIWFAMVGAMKEEK